MSALRIQVSDAVAHQPRGAQLGAAVFLWLWRLARRIGHRRPSEPPVRNATEEANQVRELALQVQRHDPRFADDLFAAADRHERAHGVN